MRSRQGEDARGYVPRDRNERTIRRRSGRTDLQRVVLRRWRVELQQQRANGAVRRPRGEHTRVHRHLRGPVEHAYVTGTGDQSRTERHGVADKVVRAVRASTRIDLNRGRYRRLRGYRPGKGTCHRQNRKRANSEAPRGHHQAHQATPV